MNSEKIYDPEKYGKTADKIEELALMLRKETADKLEEADAKVRENWKCDNASAFATKCQIMLDKLNEDIKELEVLASLMHEEADKQRERN